MNNNMSRESISFKMPEVFRKYGFVFFFYSNEGNEPMHIHVRKAGGFAKFWIEPIELEFSQGMKVNDLKTAERLIEDNMELIKDVPLEVTVRLGKTVMKIRDILDLGDGSIIELDKLAGEPVDLLVNGKLVAKGEVVVIDENFGFRVKDIISPAERLSKI